MSMIEALFPQMELAFTEAEISRLRETITRRFEETINEPPNDVYILGSFGDPRMRNKRIYRTLNPLAATLLLPAPQGAPRTANSSPCGYLSNSAWARIRKSAISILTAELMLAERPLSHPLTNYDAQRVKNELDALLVQYATSLYPFNQPLGNQTVLEYWNTFYIRPDTKILAFVFTKLFSVIPNSMNDERTGSRMTFLYSKLRSRMDVNTMIEQIQVKQWYELVDASNGQSNRHVKARPVLKFRQLPAYESSSIDAAVHEDALPVGLDDEIGDDWLSATRRVASQNAEDSDSEIKIPSHGHLALVDLDAAALADMLSDTLNLKDTVPNEDGHSLVNPQDENIRRTADVDWD